MIVGLAMLALLAVQSGLYVEGSRVGDWEVVDIQREAEYVRYWFRDAGGARTGIEIASPPGVAGGSRYVVMPAPQQTAPPELLQQVAEDLRAWAAAHPSEPPLVKPRTPYGISVAPPWRKRALTLHLIVVGAILFILFLRFRRADPLRRQGGRT